MSDDLVKRLRVLSAFASESVSVLDDAADEIERLRRALNILQAAMTAKKPIPLFYKKAIIAASVVLSGKGEKP